MPGLHLTKNDMSKQADAIAIVKAERGKDHPLHNSFLFLSKEDGKTGRPSIELPLDCRFELIPSTKPRERKIWYICGPSGVGKSYLAMQIASNYLRLFPDRKVFLISKLRQDDTIDRVPGIIRLEWENWPYSPPELKNFHSSLVVFDDCDSIAKPYKDSIMTFADDIATMGRSHSSGHAGVSLIFITHLLTNYRQTRTLLLESQFKVVFPNATNPQSLNRLLKNYSGLDKKQIKELKKENGRFSCTHSFYPNYTISKYKAKLLHQDEEED